MDIIATIAAEIATSNKLAKDAYWLTVRTLRAGGTVDLESAGRVAWERWIAADKAIALGRDAHDARMYTRLTMDLAARG